MSLAAFSGSQWPNGVALLYAAVLVAATFWLRAWYKWVALTLFIVLGAAVLAKNVSYAAIVSGPHAENSLSAHRDFSAALLGVGIMELAVAAGLVVLGIWIGIIGWRLPSGRSVRPSSLASLIGAAACAAIYAGLCMLDWQRLYAVLPAGKAVHYSISDVPWHWAAMLGTVALTVLALATPLTRARSRPAS